MEALSSVDHLFGVKFISFFEPEAHQGSGTVAKNYYVERVVVAEKTIRSEAKISSYMYLVCYQV